MLWVSLGALQKDPRGGLRAHWWAWTVQLRPT